MSIEHKNCPQKINNYAKLDTYVVERQSRNRVYTSNIMVMVMGVAIEASVLLHYYLDLHRRLHKLI